MRRRTNEGKHKISLEGWRYGAQDARGTCKRIQGLRLHHGPAPIVKNVRLPEPPPREGKRPLMTAFGSMALRAVIP